MKTRLHPTLLVYLLMFVFMAMPGVAFADSTGEDQLNLGEFLTWLEDLLRGPLGKICALLAFTAGMIAGVARGSFMAVLTGVGFAVTFYYGPGIITAVFGAVI